MNRKEWETSLKIIRHYLEANASTYSDELWKEFFTEWQTSSIPTGEDEWLMEFEEFLSAIGE